MPLTPATEFQEILHNYRAEIDRLDQDLVRFLNDRFAIIRQVAEVKAAHGIPAVLPGRVQAVLDHAESRARELGPDSQNIKEIYSNIIKLSCDLEESLLRHETAKA